MQIVLNGLISGCAIALLAVGFQLVYLPARVFFVALAGIYSLAPFVAYAAVKSGCSLIVSCIVAACASVFVSIACECLNHRRLADRGASVGVQLISSLGIYIVLVQAIAILWGNETKVLRSGLAATFHLGGALMTQPQLFTGALTSIFLLALWLSLRATGVGLCLRALADNPTQLALFGHPVNVLRIVAFAVAGIFAAVSSLLVAYDVGFDPYSGLHAILLAVVAVIIISRSSFMAPAIGGLLLGLVRAEVVWHLSARWQEAVTFGILSLVLLFRPHGLLGQKVHIEAVAP